jgi:hypothetical protein
MDVKAEVQVEVMCIGYETWWGFCIAWCLGFVFLEPQTLVCLYITAEFCRTLWRPMMNFSI